MGAPPRGPPVALDLVHALTLVGVMLTGGFLAALMFRRTGVPDILALVLLGVLLGPVSGFVDVEAFRGVVPFVGTLAVILILFDGGIEIKVGELRGGVRTGVGLAALAFAVTTVLAGVVAHFVAGMPWPHALLLGMAFGGAGVAIVIPLVQALPVARSTVTVVSVEAAFSDVLVVLGVYALAGAMAAGEFGFVDIAGALALHFVGGTAIGLAVGLGWARVMRSFEEAGYEYMLTLAVVFLVYALAEALHASGLLAVLAMGFVIGNSRKIVARGAMEAFARPREASGEAVAEGVPVFDRRLQHFQHEVVFLVRTFFFVGLGILVDPALFRDPRFVVLGLLLAGAVVAARFLAVAAVFARRGPPARDQLAIALMFPLGLAAAALSLVPSQVFGIAGTERFGDVAAVVIVLTNALAAAAVWAAFRVYGVRSKAD